jgi:hypothetical protein
VPGFTTSWVGLISSCQFLWIIVEPPFLSLTDPRPETLEDQITTQAA